MKFRRYYVPNAIVFITQVVERREPVFAREENVDLLRSILREAKKRCPFSMLAYVFMPDHFHMLIRPGLGVTHSQIMLSLKPNFTKAYKKRVGVEGAMRFWQQRYYDHVIRDEADLHRHLDYVHYNPVKHGVVSKPEEWKHSSFANWKAREAYGEMWGWSLPDTLNEFGVRGE